MSWILVLEQTPLLLQGTAVLLGLVVGSFLNVVILRLPRMMEAQWMRDCAELTGQTEGTGGRSDAGDAPAGPVDATAGGSGPPAAPDAKPLSLHHPPSTCPSCGHRIRPHENIPLLSYVLLRGRCSACASPIGLRYPLIEALTALLTLVVVLRFGLTWQLPAALILTWSLIALAMIDRDTQLLPDSITLPLLWLGLILSLFGTFVAAEAAIIGAVAGYLTLWTVFQTFRLATGKEGMGYGDFKLLAALGAWLGWTLLPQIILLSALAGAVLGLALIGSGRHPRGTPMPFGPFLAIAGWIALIWGDRINAAYLSFSGLG